jgi:hypothetical protein
MSNIEWRIDGYDFSTCNCAFGCPCQFNAAPTDGSCRAGAFVQLTHGHFGDVRLGGLSFGGLFRWPGPIHKGNGEALPIIDERATAEQRDALLKIMSGQETDPGATFFQVFFSTLSKVHEPLFKQIHFECEPHKAQARVAVEGLFEATAEPIRNPVTGRPHRVRIALQSGFEFSSAEFASGHMHTRNTPFELSWSDRHAHLCELHLTGHGIVPA